MLYRDKGSESYLKNEELTAMHQEVIDNLESIQGTLLRMNRSIQAEGTFGIIKKDRWYKRIVLHKK
nr:transposase [Butyrivibrio sp. LC3010]